MKWVLPRRGRAFSGADLLVVLAALSLLVAIALPIFLRTREKNRAEQCTSNLKQISRALQQFADENNGTLPRESKGRTGVWWWYKENVKGYLGLTGPSSPNDRVFACPSDRGFDEPAPFWKTDRFDYNSYCFNGVNGPTVAGVPNIAGHAIASIKDPARTLLVMEWTAHGPLSWHNSRTGRKNAPFYNDAESIVGFVDGHVSNTKIYFDGMNAAYTRDPVPGYAYKYSGD